eukprot:jgi/Chlat1/3493/Chrsp23S03688
MGKNKHKKAGNGGGTAGLTTPTRSQTTSPSRGRSPPAAASPSSAANGNGTVVDVHAAHHDDIDHMSNKELASAAPSSPAHSSRSATSTAGATAGGESVADLNDDVLNDAANAAMSDADASLRQQLSAQEANLQESQLEASKLRAERQEVEAALADAQERLARAEEELDVARKAAGELRECVQGLESEREKAREAQDRSIMLLTQERDLIRAALSASESRSDEVSKQLAHANKASEEARRAKDDSEKQLRLLKEETASSNSKSPTRVPEENPGLMRSLEELRAQAARAKGDLAGVQCEVVELRDALRDARMVSNRWATVAIVLTAATVSALAYARSARMR